MAEQDYLELKLTLCAMLEQEKIVDRRAANSLVSLGAPQPNQGSR